GAEEAGATRDRTRYGQTSLDDRSQQRGYSSPLATPPSPGDGDRQASAVPSGRTTSPLRSPVAFGVLQKESVTGFHLEVGGSASTRHGLRRKTSHITGRSSASISGAAGVDDKGSCGTREGSRGVH